MNDSESEAAERQTWIAFSVKCNYLDEEEGEKLLKTHNQIIGKPVSMINRPEPWLLIKK